MSTGPRRQKLNAEIVKLNPGEKAMGRYVTTTVRDWTDPTSGEVKPLESAIFEHIDPTTGKSLGERFILFVDAGLRNAMAAAAVKENDALEIVKLEKVSLGGAKSVNQYDLFALHY